MFDQTVTVYHRTDANQQDRWMPIVLEHVYLHKIAGINAGNKSSAKSLESTLIVRAINWDDAIAAGDYVVAGFCDQPEFSGSAATVLLPLGGMKIETIAENAYPSHMGNYTVTLR